MTAGQDSLTNADANPFIGLSSAEYQRLRELGDGDIAERVQLLGKVRVSCQIEEFSISVSIPGRDTVNVTFGTPLASNGSRQGFQVIRIDRTYRIGEGRRRVWLGWIHHTLPGIVPMAGSPSAFLNYEIGPFVGTVVFYDIEFQFGQPADYEKHPDCLTR